MMHIYYDNEHCCNLIKAALTDTDKNTHIAKSKIKKLILSKVRAFEDDYALHCDEIYSDIAFNFLAKEKIIKIDTDKGSPTTFILQYVFNSLRNIEKKCQLGTFYHNNSRKEDAMKLVNSGMDELLQDNSGFLDIMTEGIDYDDPETIMIRQETLARIKKSFTLAEIEQIVEGKIDKELSNKIKLFKESNLK